MESNPASGIEFLFLDDKAQSNQTVRVNDVNCFRLRDLLSELLTYRTVNFYNRVSGLKESSSIEIGSSQVQ